MNNIKIDNILDKMEVEQLRMHKFIEDLNKYSKKNGKALTYDTMVTMYLLMRITELEEKIKDSSPKLSLN